MAKNTNAKKLVPFRLVIAISSIVGIAIIAFAILYVWPLANHVSINNKKFNQAADEMVWPQNFQVTSKKFTTGSALGIDTTDTLIVTGVFSDKVTTTEAQERVKASLRANNYIIGDVAGMENLSKAGEPRDNGLMLTIYIVPVPGLEPQAPLESVQYKFFP